MATPPAKSAAPPAGSTIPTVVGRSVIPRHDSPGGQAELANGVGPATVNGTAPKRPHSPSLEESPKRLKDTDKVASSFHCALRPIRCTQTLTCPPTASRGTVGYVEACVNRDACFPVAGLFG